MEISFALTSRCNARCVHCASSCGPHRDTWLEVQEVKRLITEAAALSTGDALRVDFTGGEVFLDFDRLLDLVRFASQLGAEVGCVSNAYWATSDASASDKLRRLEQAGLSTLAISTSRFHQAFVPLSRVERAVRLARATGLLTELKVIFTQDEAGTQGAALQWSKAIPAAVHIHSPILPYLSTGQTLPEASYPRMPGLPREVCPGQSLAISENGMAYSCATPGADHDFLSLGDSRAIALAELQHRLQQGAKQRLLREHGPAYFAGAAILAGDGQHLREAYANACDLCLHIAHTDVLAQAAASLCEALHRARHGPTQSLVPMLGKTGAPDLADCSGCPSQPGDL
ncbi:Radical SAM superfamily protein [Solimonas aquatica]|uniref:Radical SAM superfamily protein n=1 Tax=Solimonas aquatica TaxID=489703 RepID=A0A1H9M701_9GAMM|nr:radical SAM protein [Solimonas aquatica]SER19265.1 Radical SAM superfamily protein [Solimonas aquatica]